MLFEIILEAWIALKRNLTRSFLTMLGIVWGIATVTLLIAYGSSFRGVLVHGFDAFGKSVVICWPQQTSEQPGGQRAGLTGTTITTVPPSSIASIWRRSKFICSPSAVQAWGNCAAVASP